MVRADEENWPDPPMLDNIGGLLSDNREETPLLLLNFAAITRILVHMMKWLSIVLMILIAAPATAGCYADYKAKKDSPLRLHYGVMELSGNACNSNAARGQISTRLNRNGWSLLEIISVFDDSGLSERRESAGDYYLRF